MGSISVRSRCRVLIRCTRTVASRSVDSLFDTCRVTPSPEAAAARVTLTQSLPCVGVRRLWHAAEQESRAADDGWVRMQGALGLDLVEAMRRQQGFMRSMLAERALYEDRRVVEGAVRDYCAFLFAMRESEALEPTPLVDLVTRPQPLRSEHLLPCASLSADAFSPPRSLSHSLAHARCLHALARAAACSRYPSRVTGSMPVKGSDVPRR